MLGNDLQQLEKQLDSSTNIQNAPQKSKRSGCKKAIFAGVFVLIIVTTILIALAILAPGLFLVVINILWVVLLGIVVTFILLGILVMLGLKKQATEILNIMLEGSLTLLDIADFAKEIYRTFVRYLKELLLFVIPIFALLTNFFIYIVILFVFKLYGKENDVTAFTILLTIALVFITGFFNRPKKKKPGRPSWIAQLREKYTHAFKDGLEILIFVFFLTMDSTNLFFLPKDLNVELHAQVGDYNLMKRSVIIDKHLQITITLIMFSILVEVFRNILRLVVKSIKNYQIATDFLEKRNKQFKTAQVIKLAVRQSVKTSMDELLKFITFTTIIIAVFILFPRLKLLTVIVASAAALILDFIIRSRLTAERGDDLISRIISKVFRL